MCRELRWLFGHGRNVFVSGRKPSPESKADKNTKSADFALCLAICPTAGHFWNETFQVYQTWKVWMPGKQKCPVACDLPFAP
jgi:hypothetical protein